jgi:hypothetical protein
MRPNFTADYDNGISIAPGADTPPALTARSFGCELADSRTATQSSIRELDPGTGMARDRDEDSARRAISTPKSRASCMRQWSPARPTGTKARVRPWMQASAALMDDADAALWERQ